MSPFYVISPRNFIVVIDIVLQSSIFCFCQISFSLQKIDFGDGWPSNWNIVSDVLYLSLIPTLVDCT